jgi:hypothetical protein
MHMTRGTLVTVPSRSTSMAGSARKAQQLARDERKQEHGSDSCARAPWTTQTKGMGMTSWKHYLLNATADVYGARAPSIGEAMRSARWEISRPQPITGRD